MSRRAHETGNAAEDRALHESIGDDVQSRTGEAAGREQPDRGEEHPDMTDDDECQHPLQARLHERHHAAE